MFAVFAVYPEGSKLLVGYAHRQVDVDWLISDCIETNEMKKLDAAGIEFSVELVG